MDKLLAIFDTNSLYASRLMEYLKKSDLEGFDILLFTKKESLADFIKYQEVDILLLGGDRLFEEIPKESIKYIFWLSEDKGYMKDKHDTIYKYQSAANITSEILSLYTRLEDENHNSLYGDVRFVVVYPPVPGIEKISYAWSLAKKLSKTRKVLFIAFDIFPTSCISRHEDMGQSMSELLYYLKESKSDYMDRLKSYISYSEKLSYLSGPAHGFDLLSLGNEDIIRFMEDLREHADYEIIIFYLGIYTEGSMEILSRCNEICIATCSLPYEELVVSEWERQMELIGMPIKKLRINRIKLPTAEQAAGNNPLAEDIYTAISPLASELAARI